MDLPGNRENKQSAQISRALAAMVEYSWLAWRLLSRYRLGRASDEGDAVCLASLGVGMAMVSWIE